jgi:formate dehydrogenase (coenzyme F420) beta subunit
MIGLIPVESTDPLATVRGFLRQLLETGLVEAIYVPLEMDGGAVVPALVVDPEQLSHANPLAPAMSINGARAVSALTGKHAPTPIAAVLRPCELRALIELVKLQQASLEDVTLISLDCPGTYEWTDFIDAQRSGKLDLPGFLDAGSKGSASGLRPACQMCTHPIPEHAQIHLRLYGADLTQGIPVYIEDGVADLLEMVEAKDVRQAERQSAIDSLVAGRQQTRQKELDAMQALINSNGSLAGGSAGGFAEVFASCIRCFNCMTACPICYCKNCLFRTAAFDHPAEHYVNSARLKGAMRLPGDTLLFHLTRLNHMGASCVSCGMCTSACPSEIPVGMVFSLIGGQVQGAFEYVPGRDVNEALPLITFQADEWTEIGERKL